MDQDVTLDLGAFGLAAAREMAGPEAIEGGVEVEEGVDAWDRPAYHFTDLIDRDRLLIRLGLIMTRLSQKLRDDLDARGDAHLPQVRLLDRTDWEKRARGRAV